MHRFDLEVSPIKRKIVNRSIGVIIVAFSLLLVAFVSVFVLHLDFYLKKPQDKFAAAWQSDMTLLEKSGKLPKEWQEIKEISVKGQASPATEWVEDVLPPISATKKGKYRLNIFVIHWIDGYRYGVVIQYDLVDIQTQNVVSEIGRTLKLGFVY